MSGVFLGKVTIGSTNGSGAQVFLQLVSAGTVQVAEMSATSAVEWVLYDGGEQNGQETTIVATPLPNALYLSVDSSTNYVVATSDPASATAFWISPSGSNMEWQAYVSGSWQQAQYAITGFTGLVVAPQLNPDTLGTLAQATVTPSLATIQSSATAAGDDLSGVDLTDASFAGVDCTGANFTNALLDDTDFTNATLTNANFTSTNLTTAEWGTTLSAAGATFGSSIAFGVTFPSAANLQGASFVGADFGGTNLSSANLSSALLYDANFAGASLGSASLAGANGGESASGDYVGVDLSGAYLADANFRNAHLEGADLSHAQMYYVATGALDGAFLIDTILSGADATGMSFNGTTVEGANMDGMILASCAFTSVTFQPSPSNNPVILTNAHLEGATFTECSLTQVHLNGAYVATTNGVPLFTTPLLSAYTTALNQNTLPDGLTAIFATAGYLLSSTATVTAGATSGTWTVTQSATIATLGAEITGYALVSSSSELEIFSSQINLTEALEEGTFNFPLPVEATTLPASIFDGATCCPNGATNATNTALGSQWTQMMTALRAPLASL